ncbi:MAG: hypothetical protein IH987_15030 [Planctomycetes bacterium]|nr:hypothetical protein [Planctomycetota bacterium]
MRSSIAAGATVGDIDTGVVVGAGDGDGVRIGAGVEVGGGVTPISFGGAVRVGVSRESFLRCP